MSSAHAPKLTITDELREQMTPEDAALVEAYYSSLRPEEGYAYEYGT